MATASEPDRKDSPAGSQRVGDKPVSACPQDQPTLPPGEPGEGEIFANPTGTFSAENGSSDLSRTSPSSAEVLGPSTGLVAGYEILGVLGRGGMGVVYKARQVQLGRLVALKMILAGAHAGSSDRDRFRTEAEAIARLQHANIVQVHEIGEHEGKPFFSLEFCSGGSLDRKLNGTPLPAQEAARLLETLARAMQAAHSQSVIHRDLKPANVLLAADGTPKITDFGLAKKLDDVGQTASGAIMGTPSYMAPEQANGSKQIGPAADVYALGAILYECLTGRPPFKAATPLDTILQVAMDEPVPPSQLQPKTPRDLETICLKCLHKEAGKRYASAAELADELGRFVRGEPIEARPAGWAERGWKWAKRRPTAAALTLVSVLALLVLLVGGLWFNARLTEQRNEATEQRNEALRQKKTAEEQKDLADERARAEAKAKLEAQGERNRAEEQKKLAEEKSKLAQEKTKLAETEKARAETQLRRAEWALYAAQLARAQSAFENNDAALALRLLEECQWDLRGWEHRYLWTRLSSKATFVGHTDEVTGVAFSPDGRRILTGSQDKTAKVWDAATGQELFALKGHINGVSSVAFSPDGRRILTGSWDKTAKVWDADKGQELFALKGHINGVSSVAFSPDGRRLLTGSQDGTAKVWDADKGQELFSLKGHTDQVFSVAFSRDGRRILTGSNDNTAKVWDADKGTELFSLKGHTGSVTSVAFSPDGRRLLTGSQDQTAKVWDADKGQELFSLKGHTGSVTSVAFSPDGQRLLTGSGEQAKVWDADKGQELFSLKGHRSWVLSVAFSPDGRRILTGSQDQTAKVWDAAKGQKIFSLKGPFFGVAFSPDGRRILTGSREQAKVWDAETGQELLSLTGHKRLVLSVAFSPDGRRLLTGSSDDSAKVWDAETGQELFSLKGHKHWVTSVAFSPDGRRLLTGSQDQTAKVWDADKGQELFSLKGHTDHVLSAAFSPDGRRILTGSQDQTAKVWDAANGEELFSLKGHTYRVNSVAFSRDGRRILTGSQDQTARVWDAETGQELFSLKEAGDPVAFSPDDRRILTGSFDHTGKVWEAGKGQELFSLKGHVNGVNSMAFSPDGRRILTAGWDNTAKVWDADKSQEVLTLKGHTYWGVSSVAFSPDGRRLFVQDRQGKILAWDTTTGHLLPDPPTLMPADAALQATSPDGRLLVRIQNDAPVVERLTDRPRDEHPDRAALERLARFDPDFHTARLAEAESAHDDFAAAFHLRWLAAAPLSEADAAQWEQQARQAVLRQRNALTLHRHGVALYRAGKHEQAAQVLAESLKVQGQEGLPDTWLFQALAAKKQGQHAEARTLLARFEAWHQKQTFTDWRQRTLYQLLLAEARGEVTAKPAGPAKK